MKNIPFLFYKTQMIIRVTTEETQGQSAIIEMTHIPSVGPARHVHPRGPESFVVLEGTYTFFLGDNQKTLTAGEAICVPANTPHRYLVGTEGGRLLVVCPPYLENYFWEVAQRLQQGTVSQEDEFAIAAQYGQDFLDLSEHWGHK